MNHRFANAGLGIVLALLTASAARAEDVVNVYTYREPQLIQPLFDAFTKETGVKVNVVFAKDGLEDRIASEGAASPADMLLTVDIGRLSKAVDLGFASTVDSETLAATIPAAYRDGANAWFGVSMRARVIYASKDRVPDGPIAYEDLADPKYKGKVCIRDGQHVYNIALFADYLLKNGPDKTKAWLIGLRDNLARKPSGGDRDVAKDIAAGVCDIGLGNTYYVGLMQANAEQKPWVDAIKVVMPTFADGTTHVNVSGFVIVKTAPNMTNAIKLGEWLTGKEAQQIYSAQNYEYPVRADVPLDPVVAAFGTLKPDTASLSDIAKLRKDASALVDEIAFNEGAVAAQ
jgi:iron(III) transport system substrate-binding protein